MLEAAIRLRPSSIFRNWRKLRSAMESWKAEYRHDAAIPSSWSDRHDRPQRWHDQCLWLRWPDVVHGAVLRKGLHLSA
jgi:hypothetical protein